MLSGTQRQREWSGAESDSNRWLTFSDIAALRPQTFTPSWTKTRFIEWPFRGREVRYDQRGSRQSPGALPRIAASARFRNAGGRPVASRLSDLSPRAYA